jgi:hypothetical protein
MIGHLRRALVASAMLCAVAAPVLADRAPPASLRPEARPVVSFTPPSGLRPPSAASPEVGRVMPASPRAVAAAPRPEPRPRGLARRSGPASTATPVAAAPTVTAPAVERPRSLGTLFQRAAQPQASRRGSVCGNRAIRGEEIAPIRGERRGCGIAEPVRVIEVAGIRLSTPATIDCATAQALNTWVEQGAKPAIGRKGGGLVAVQVAAHYACRTRNNRPGARISEHGRGKAIDISAFVLANGQRITVLHGWRSRENRRALRQMHEAACGPFGTVLGPNSDRFHQDHFHFDTARYRSGPYCR